MPQASDSDKLDGLNTHMGIFDEIHEFKDYKLISVIKTQERQDYNPFLYTLRQQGTN